MSRYDEWQPKRAPRRTADLRRVEALERREVPDDVTREAMVELVTRRYRLPDAPCSCVARHGFCVERLKPEQAWALYEIGLARGLVAHIPVGCGKSGVDFLAPLALGATKALLLYPASLLKQLAHDELPKWRAHWRLPSVVFHGVDARHLGEVGCTLHVMSYARLSLPGATDMLERYGFDAIICDEVHKLKNSTSARYCRLARYFAAHPETRFAGWSGSLTDAGLVDYWHFCAFALRERSPLPLTRPVVEEWATAVDPSDDPAPPGALGDAFCEPGESVQSGYSRRFRETRGIVVTDKASCDAEVVVAERPAPEIPDTVRESLKALRDDWCRPDGEDIVDRLSLARCARELACGFYYYWYFPRGEKRETIVEWLAARKEWRSELREKLQRGAEFLDSEYLATRAAKRHWGDECEPSIEECLAEVRRRAHVTGAGADEHGDYHANDPDAGIIAGVDALLLTCDRLRRSSPTPLAGETVRRWIGEYLERSEDAEMVAAWREALAVLEKYRDLPTWHARAWPRWRDVMDSVEPETRTERLDDFLARDAAAWAHERRGVVWYASRALGQWVAEISGLRRFGGGPRAEREIGEWVRQRGGAPSIVASIKSHGTGREGLQLLYSECLFAEPPSSPTAWEQAIGRFHRQHQAADRVVAGYYAHTREIRDAVDRARARAEYVEETIGAAQKIVGAGIAPRGNVY